MLHLIYILAFTILAFLAVGNLIRNLMTLGVESQRPYRSPSSPPSSGSSIFTNGQTVTPHPELLDEAGNIVREPYLVMRSITVEDAREQLDAIFRSSPGTPSEEGDDSPR